MVQKTLEEARANFEASVSYIPARYEAGVDKANWLDPAKSAQAEKNYADGVGKAVAAKSRQKAIAGMSNEDWKNAAKTKGAAIIGTRISEAVPKWAAKFGEVYAKVLPTVQALPPKTTDWRSNITKRLVPTVEAWRKAAGRT